MRPLPSVCVYFALVFLGGGLLAPWLYWLVHWGASVIPGLESLARNPFHRFVNRSLLALGIIGLWPFLRSVGIRSWKDVGLRKSSAWVKRAGGGFLVGFGSLACVASLAVALGPRSLQPSQTATEILRHVGNAGLAAIAVGILEEVFFRGALFGALRKACAWPVALVLSSGLYAIVHFFERPGAPATVEWTTGLVVLVQMLRGFGDLDALVPGFLNLTLAGMILGLGYQRTGSLYFSMGLHAGWIFWLKSYGFLTKESGQALSWFWGSNKLIDGWLACGILAAALFLLERKLSSAPESGPISDDETQNE